MMMGFRFYPLRIRGIPTCSLLWICVQVALRATATQQPRFVPMSMGDRCRAKKDGLRREFVEWTHDTFWAPDVASSLIRAYGQDVPDGVIPLMHHNTKMVRALP